MREDKRSPEFLAHIKAVSARLKTIKRLQLKGSDNFEHRHILTYIAPKTLTLTSRDKSGKEVFYYRTDARASLTRMPGKRAQRGKPGVLPIREFEFPKLIAVLLGQNTLADYGIPPVDDFERTYLITKKVQENRPVLRLSYNGADYSGRSQDGMLIIDQKTGLPVGFEEEQAGNSPRDSGEYSNWESWTILAIR